MTLSFSTNDKTEDQRSFEEEKKQTLISQKLSLESNFQTDKFSLWQPNYFFLMHKHIYLIFPYYFPLEEYTETKLHTKYEKSFLDLYLKHNRLQTQ